MTAAAFAPEKFFHKTRLRVRFRDVDAMQHVHHGVYLTYMESARIRYLDEVLGWSGSDLSTMGIIVARVEVDYRQPLHFDEEVVVHTRVSRVGTKSFDMLYLLQRIVDNQPAEVVATGTTFLVAYDYVHKQTQPVPASWRNTIVTFEKALKAKAVADHKGTT